MRPLPLLNAVSASGAVTNLCNGRDEKEKMPSHIDLIDVDPRGETKLLQSFDFVF